IQGHPPVGVDGFFNSTDQVAVVDGEDPTLAGRHMFLVVETEYRHIPKRADAFPTKGSTKTLGAVFYHITSVLTCKGRDRIDITGNSKEVRCNNNFSLLCHTLLDCPNVRVQISRRVVDENRLSPRVQDSVDN